MGKLIDLTGKKFGRLTVIKRDYSRNNKRVRNAYWLCKCECGNEKIIRDDSLRKGLTKSCGCWAREWAREWVKKYSKFPKLGYGISNMRRIIYSYKKHAKKRGLEWDLTEEQFKEIAQQDCYYCGVKPNNIGKIPKTHGEYTYNGIDRIDNNKGYTIDNIVPCCKRCNIAKNNSTLQKFQDWIKRVYDNLKRKEMV